MAQRVDRSLIVAVAGGVIVLAAALGGSWLVVRGDKGPKTLPPASMGGLVVQMGQSSNAPLDPNRQLRCFVNGQFEGMETLSDCAKKNGVATEALDVGIDQTGALAAASPSGDSVTPLPPAEAEASGEAAGPGSVAAQSAPRGPAGECWRYGGGGWRKVGDGLTLDACVQLLFAGHCARPGEAAYGRWMGQTVRLVPHEVQISPDNMNFRPVVEQSDQGCVIPDF